MHVGSRAKFKKTYSKMSYNNFREACEYVEKPAHKKIYKRIYEPLIKNEGWGYEEVHDKERQTKGIDVILTTPWGEVYIDEKAKEKTKDMEKAKADNEEDTFGLELTINPENYDGKIGPTKTGWFLKEAVTTHYLMYYKESHGDGIYKKTDEYVMLVNAKKLKEKIFSIPGLDRDSLLNPSQDGILDIIIGSKIKDGRIFYDRDRREHGRFLVLPLSFYRSIEGTCVYKIKD